MDASAAFRRGNEAIARAAENVGRVDRTVDFICECVDDDCLAAVPLTLSAYRRARNGGLGVVVASGHEPPSA